MSYIGNKPSQTLASPTSQYFNGTGSQTVFTLNRLVNVSEDLEVFVNNIQQEPGVGKSYTATGSTLTFDAAPSAGTSNVYVVYRGLAEVTTRLETDPNSAISATTGTFSGGIDVTGNATFADNGKAVFGAGNDLQVYHDGSHSYVSDAGTGNLQLSTNGTAIKMLRGNGEVLSSFNIGGSVDLYHSNAKKVETTASGINVTGNIEVYNDDVDGYIWFHDAGTRSWSVGSDQSTGNFVVTNVQGIASGQQLSLDNSGNLTATGSITATGGFVGAGSTPAFCVTRNSDQTSTAGIATLVQWNAEIYDSDGKFANNRFTPTEAGYYYLFAQVNNNNLYNQAALNIWIRKNGSNIMRGAVAGNNSTSNRDYTINCSIINVADSDDYFEVYAEQQIGNGQMIASADRCVFLGYKVG